MRSNVTHPENYEIASSVVSQPVGAETVLVDLRTESCFGLDRIGSLVWSELAKGTSVRAIVDVVVGRFEVPAAQAAADVRRLLADLQRAELVGRPA
jgi:Coenzyme PQQ synthesis protein D (PqqD).